MRIDKEGLGAQVATQFEQSLNTIESQFGTVVRQRPESVIRGVFSGARYGRAQLIDGKPNTAFENGDFIHLRPETYGDSLACDVGTALERVGALA